jgi:hypothetical protein
MLEQKINVVIMGDSPALDEVYQALIRSRATRLIHVLSDPNNLLFLEQLSEETAPFDLIIIDSALTATGLAMLALEHHPQSQILIINPPNQPATLLAGKRLPAPTQDDISRLCKLAGLSGSVGEHEAEQGRKLEEGCYRIGICPHIQPVQL